MDVSPYINSDDRTLVPLRFLSYALGVPESGVKWADKDQTTIKTILINAGFEGFPAEVEYRISNVTCA